MPLLTLTMMECFLDAEQLASRLDDLHQHLGTVLPGASMPSFAVEDVSQSRVRRLIQRRAHEIRDREVVFSIFLQAYICPLLHVCIFLTPGHQVTSTSLMLHYFSQREGLWPMLSGILKALASDQVGQNLYGLGIRMHTAGSYLTRRPVVSPSPASRSSTIRSMSSL